MIGSSHRGGKMPHTRLFEPPSPTGEGNFRLLPGEKLSAELTDVGDSSLQFPTPGTSCHPLP